MIKKLGLLGERFCLLCAAAFCGLILLQSVFASLHVWGVVTAAGFVCAVAVVVFAVKFWPFGERKTALILFLTRFVLAMAVILIVDAQPVQDFNTMYIAARDMATGSRAYLDNIYFYKWAYQTGFAWYESLLLRIFGPDQFSLQVMNALWLGGIGALVYKLAGMLLPKRMAVGVSVLYAVYPAPYFLAAVLTNQHIATFFLYLAVWLLMREEELSLRSSILAGIAIAVGNVMRPIGVVLILAILCWRAFRLLLQGGRDWRGTLWKSAAILISYYAVFSLVSGAVVWSGLNPEGLGNNLPTWKFVVGINQESDGTWNRADYEAFQLVPATAEEAEELMQQVAEQRLSVGPVELAKLAVRKSAVMWGTEEYMYWGFGHLNGQAEIGPLTVNQCTQILSWGDKGVYLAAFALALLGLLSLLRRGTTQGGPTLLLSFLLCGYYAVHLIVEVQSRYRYFLLPTVFVLAGFGLNLLSERKGLNKNA